VSGSSEIVGLARERREGKKKIRECKFKVPIRMMFLRKKEHKL
jgi:hypothetical protein